MRRYIFITGGVLSSLGKGLASAALGALLQAQGYSVRLRKLDPYINVDPGTMSPFQHGEVYVTEDGAETDLDLGHYERFTGVANRSSDAFTTGQIYAKVIAKERRGDYLGATVQVIPHVTDMIKEFIVRDVEDNLDFLVCEIGGTVGDIEGLPYLEAIRQFVNEVGHDQAMFVHLTLVPYIASAHELKTKPSQHSVKELLHAGIQPDILLCRSDRPIPDGVRKKLGLFCNIKPDSVIAIIDVDTIYQVPVSYSEEGLDVEVLKHFGLEPKVGSDLSNWQQIVDHIRHPKDEVTIGVVGKYTGLQDAYKSINEALQHGGISNTVRVTIRWINAEILEDGPENNRVAKSDKKIDEVLRELDGILVPGAFGSRGIAGKMAGIKYAREHRLPYFGICFGLQLAVIEFAQNVLGIASASSSEFGSTNNPVIGLMTEWRRGEQIETRKEDGDLGGTMRLGLYECHLSLGSLAHKIYGKDVVNERHRHRYEVNMSYRARLESKGMKFSGLSPDGALTEVIEVNDHPWFLAMQCHPEFQSRPFDPHPAFTSFIEAALEYKSEKHKAT